MWRRSETCSFTSNRTLDHSSHPGMLIVNGEAREPGTTRKQRPRARSPLRPTATTAPIGIAALRASSGRARRRPPSGRRAGRPSRSIRRAKDLPFFMLPRSAIWNSPTGVPVRRRPPPASPRAGLPSSWPAPFFPTRIHPTRPSGVLGRGKEAPREPVPNDVDTDRRAASSCRLSSTGMPTSTALCGWTQTRAIRN